MKKWKRVSGPDLDLGNNARANLNKNVQESKIFIDSCKLAGIEPTRKQASKYRRKKGLVFNCREIG